MLSADTRGAQRDKLTTIYFYYVTTLANIIDFFCSPPPFFWPLIVVNFSPWGNKFYVTYA